MTAIVGIADGVRVYLGSDSLSCDGEDGAWLGGTKLFRLGSMLAGCSGGKRAVRIMQYEVRPPRPRGDDPEAYVARDLARRVHSTFRTLGAAEQKNGRDTWDGSALVGYRGVLFHLGADFGVTRLVRGWGSTGSGAYSAEGALYATAGLDPLERLRIALEAAETCSDGVRRPFHYEVLKR